MKIFFAGTDEFALKPLEIINKNFEIVGVLTKAPSENKNRKKQIIPVKELSKKLGIKNIFQFKNLKLKEIELIKKINPDVLVCVSYGKIFGPKFLEIFKHRLNLHPSKLPKYRGPSPLEEAILNLDESIGICVQDLALKMDSGDIYKETELILNGKENIQELTKKSSKKGADLLFEVLKDIKEEKEIKKRVQDEESASYCHLIKKEQYKIDWEKEGEKIESMIRAYYPNAFTIFDDKKLLITKTQLIKKLDYNYNTNESKNGFVFKSDKKIGILIKVKDGFLAVKKMKIQNKKEMEFIDFLNGHKNIISSTLI